VEAVDRVEEKVGANAFVEVVAFAPEAVEGGSFGQQRRGRRRAADGIERAVAFGRAGSLRRHL
jgi:hypothetical protein